VQECVTNAIRHGRATQIGFRILVVNHGRDEADRDLHIQIVDNGCGPDGASVSTRGNGAGLSNIRARATAVGARFLLERVGNQTIATVMLPLPADNND
jgi:signal transduction histidine kinase